MTIVLRTGKTIEIYCSKRGIIPVTICELSTDKKNEWMVVSETMLGGIRYCACHLNAQGRYQRISNWKLDFDDALKAMKFSQKPW